MGISETIALFAVQFIQNTGYLSVFILMVFESMVLPVPSEAVMPFAGWLIATGTFSWPIVILVSTLGSIVGSLLSYAAGYYGGTPFIKRFGRYFFLNNEHLERTHNFFEKRGSYTIFICRFIPVVRHLISIPAGVARMNIGTFILLTVLGAGIWNTALTFVGTVLQKNWERIMQYSKFIDIAIVIVLLSAIGVFLVRQIRKARSVQ